MQLNVVQTTRSVLLVEHVVIITRRSALAQELLTSESRMIARRRVPDDNQR